MTTTFIINPISSSGRTAKRFDKLRPLIAELFGNVKILKTQNPRNATVFAKAAIKEGASLIVAVGGDGTVNEVVNGFFENGQPINPTCPLAVLMSGTGGDFRRSFGWSGNLSNELLRIKNGVAKPVDVGVVHATQPDTSTEPRYFLNCASVGLSGLVALKVQQMPSVRNRFAYLKAALKALGEYKSSDLSVVVDGAEKLLPEVTALAFANAAYFAGGMHIAKGASVNDGLAEVVSIASLGRIYALLNAPRIYFGTHLSLKRVTHFRAQRMSIKAPDSTPILVETDGEPCGQLPATFEILKEALLLIQ